MDSYLELSFGKIQTTCYSEIILFFFCTVLQLISTQLTFIDSAHRICLGRWDMGGVGAPQSDEGRTFILY